MTQKCDIAIIGCGKVGCALAHLAISGGWRVSAVASKTHANAIALANSLDGDTIATTPPQAAAQADLVFLTTTDSAIARACTELADSRDFKPGTIVAHCSGALDSGILSAARDRCQCSIASIHPLQTFPNAQAAIREFPGTYCFCEGDPRAVEVLMQFASDIGGKPVLIDASRKALYHASAVMACNYLTALLDASATLAEKAGIDRTTALDALRPLVNATLDNVAALGPDEALTGPIARGDADTVSRHLQAMSLEDDCPEAFYRQAGIWTLRMAQRSKNFDKDTAETLRSLLEQTDQD